MPQNPVDVGSWPHSRHRSKFPEQWSNGGWHQPLPVLTTIIIVARNNTVEIGNQRFQGMPWICSCLNLSVQEKTSNYDIADTIWNCRISNTCCDKRTLTTCAVKAQPVSLGGAYGKKTLHYIYPLPEQLLPDEIRIYSWRIKSYSDHYKCDIYS
jgi:hypothetical protein